GPLLVSHWLSRIWLTRCRKASRSPMFGRPTCSGWSNAGGAPLMARSALLRISFVDKIDGPPRIDDVVWIKRIATDGDIAVSYFPSRNLQPRFRLIACLAMRAIV